MILFHLLFSSSEIDTEVIQELTGLTQIGLAHIFASYIAINLQISNTILRETTFYNKYNLIFYLIEKSKLNSEFQTEFNFDKFFRFKNNIEENGMS